MADGRAGAGREGRAAEVRPPPDALEPTDALAVAEAQCLRAAFAGDRLATVQWSWIADQIRKGIARGETLERREAAR